MNEPTLETTTAGTKKSMLSKTSSPTVDILSHVRIAIQIQETARNNLMAAMTSHATLPTFAFSVPKLPTFNVPNTRFPIEKAFAENLRIGKSIAAAISNLSAQMQARLQSAFDFSTALNANIKSIHSIANQFDLMLPRMNFESLKIEPHLPSSIMMQTIGSPLAKTSEAFRGIQSVIAAKNSIESSIRSFMQLESLGRGSISRMAGNLKAMTDRLQLLNFDDLERIVQDLNARDIAFASFGSEVRENAVHAVVSEVLSDESLRQRSLEELIWHLINWTKKQDNDAGRRLMSDFLINLSASLVFLIATSFVSSWLQSNSEIATNTQLKDARNVLASAMSSRNNANIVVRYTPVRTSRKGKSSIIDYLYPGSVVFVDQKVGNRTHVEWMDSTSGRLLSGWILSKYLSPIVK